MPAGGLLVDPWDALLGAPAPGVVRIGLAVPLSGPLALTAPSALELASLAAEESRAAGRPVELVPVDAGRAPAVVAAETTRLREAGVFDTLVGFHTSDVHRALSATWRGPGSYLFTPPHEGGGTPPGVHRTGPDPLAQHAGALRWLVDHRRARRWVLLGTDYVWPRAVHRVARGVLHRLGALVVGEALVPFGPTDPGPLLDLVLRSRADAVLLTLVGADLALFHREFARAGLDRRVLRLSGALEENGLYALGGDRTGELYACMPSFAAAAGSRDEHQLALQERHAARVGAHAPVVCAYARGLYDGVRLALDPVGDGPGGWPRAARPAGPRAARPAGPRAEQARAARAEGPRAPRPDRPRLARAEGLAFAPLLAG